MPIAYTSRVGLASIVDTLGGLQHKVYLSVKGWNSNLKGPGPSIEDIARELHIKESSVCGRVNELLESGAITTGPMKVNTTGKPAKTYKALVYQKESLDARQSKGQLNLL